MRYIRVPEPNGSATNRSAVSAESPAYPRASGTPVTYSSPVTPGGTGHKRSSSTCTPVLSIGVPIGTSGRSPGPLSQTVTSQVTSVAPYLLWCGRPIRSCRSRVSGSPPTKIRFSSGSSPSASTVSSIDGTKWTVFTPCRFIRSTRYAGSRCPPGAATTVVAPACSGQNSSHTETVNTAGDLCSTRSPGSSRYVRCSHVRWLTTDACDTTTPFGLPVEPEVNSTYAALSGRTRTPGSLSGKASPATTVSGVITMDAPASASIASVRSAGASRSTGV